MNIYLKQFLSSFILIAGLILFFLSLLNNSLNSALSFLACSLIFWVTFSLIFETFNIKIFSWVMSSSGFLIAISIFFIYGIEQVAHPIGAIIFHSGGIASSLGIGLISLFPILILYQINSNNNMTKSNLKNPDLDLSVEPEVNSDDWEIVSDKELENGDFEIK